MSAFYLRQELNLLQIELLRSQQIPLSVLACWHLPGEVIWNLMQFSLKKKCIWAVWSCQRWIWNWCQCFVCLPPLSPWGRIEKQQVYLESNPEFSVRQRRPGKCDSPGVLGECHKKMMILLFLFPSRGLDFSAMVLKRKSGWQQRYSPVFFVLQGNSLDRRGKVSSKEVVLQSFRVGALNA